MVTVRRYCDVDKEVWNKFNKESKNSMFMFDRNYMDYHRDRFDDHSLMFYDDNKLIALLPMNEREGILYSHGGLTYGGFISDSRMKQHTMNSCFDTLLAYAESQKIKKIVYKCIPHIYHKQASEEDRYALYAHGANLATVDVSTYVNFTNPLKMPKGRKAQISRAKREGVIVIEMQELSDFNAFIALENEVLCEKHGTKAVHTGAELKLLHDRFPDGVKLICGKKNGKMIAGAVIYVYDTVVHTQYMAANEEARVIGALDLVVNTVIDRYKESKNWLDFGISTERGKIYLNEGLAAQKEGFGGRTGVYEIWEISTRAL